MGLIDWNIASPLQGPQRELANLGEAMSLIQERRMALARQKAEQEMERARLAELARHHQAMEADQAADREQQRKLAEAKAKQDLEDKQYTRGIDTQKEVRSELSAGRPQGAVAAAQARGATFRQAQPQLVDVPQVPDFVPPPRQTPSPEQFGAAMQGGLAAEGIAPDEAMNVDFDALSRRVAGSMSRAGNQALDDAEMGDVANEAMAFGDYLDQGAGDAFNRHYHARGENARRKAGAKGAYELLLPGNPSPIMMGENEELQGRLNKAQGMVQAATPNINAFIEKLDGKDKVWASKARDIVLQGAMSAGYSKPEDIQKDFIAQFNELMKESGRNSRTATIAGAQKSRFDEAMLLRYAQEARHVVKKVMDDAQAKQVLDAHNTMKGILKGLESTNPASQRSSLGEWLKIKSGGSSQIAEGERKYYVEAVASWPEKAKNKFNEWLGGGKLAPEYMAKFAEAVRTIELPKNQARLDAIKAKGRKALSDHPLPALRQMAPLSDRFTEDAISEQGDGDESDDALSDELEREGF